MNTWKCLEVLMPTDPTSLDEILNTINLANIQNLPYEHDNEDDEEEYNDEYSNFDEVEEEEGLNPEIPSVIPENCLHHETGEILKNPIHIPHIGWFESNDPRIKNDFMSFVSHYEHCKIIDDKKYNKFYTYLGCGKQDFILYFQAKLKEGMTWENHGEWHIDHIKPCALFNLLNEEEQKKCFHYTNLQPLWASENLSKGSKYVDESL